MDSENTECGARLNRKSRTDFSDDVNPGSREPAPIVTSKPHLICKNGERIDHVSTHS